MQKKGNKDQGTAPYAPAAANPFWTLRGLEGQAARKMLLKTGAKEKWVIEVYPDDQNPKYAGGDRWFLEIVNGLVCGSHKAEYILSCRWFQKNSVTNFEANEPLTPIQILAVKGYGPVNCLNFLRFIVSAPQPAAPAPSKK